MAVQAVMIGDGIIGMRDPGFTIGALPPPPPSKPEAPMHPLPLSAKGWGDLSRAGGMAVGCRQGRDRTREALSLPLTQKGAARSPSWVLLFTALHKWI